MRKNLIVGAVVLSVFMFLLGGYVVLNQHGVSAEASCTSTTAQVSVIGVASRDVTPDRGVVTINVVGTDKDADKAMEIMKESAAYVLSVAESYTDEKHIKTTGLSLSQRGHWEKDRYIYDEFVASESIKVDLEVGKVSQFLGEVTGGKAEHIRISGISFYYTEIDKVKKELLEEAIQDAQDNAIHLVKPLGAEFISLISVSYGGFSPLSYDDRFYGVKAEAASDVPVSAGSQHISVQVNAVFKAGPICTSIGK